MPVDKQPYGPDAGDAAVQAAHDGNLRLQDVSFAYPLRPNSGGEANLAVRSHCYIAYLTGYDTNITTVSAIAMTETCSSEGIDDIL